MQYIEGNVDIHEMTLKLSGMNPVLGHIRGRVTDIDGYGISHGRIWIRETGRCTYTDSRGNYVLINVPPAICTLIAESEGYSQSTLVDIHVESGDNPGNNFIMFTKCNRLRPGRRRGALAFAMWGNNE
jgi:hypothetical protein